MFLGLRMMCGVEEERFAEQFGRPMTEVYGKVIERLCAQGLLVREGNTPVWDDNTPARNGRKAAKGGGRLRLSKRGIDISNYVMSQFLFDETE